MNRFTIVALLSFTVWTAGVCAQETPSFPAPQKEHEWLRQLVGEWDVESEAHMAPGQPPLKCKGSERVRSLGGFWIVGEGESEVMGIKMQSVLTLGYDPEKKKYIGTWVDSMTNHLWKYEGTLDADRNVLTLEAEGPSFTDPRKHAKYRDVITLESKDHKVLTSSVQSEDGLWSTFMTADYRRKE